MSVAERTRAADELRTRRIVIMYLSRLNVVVCACTGALQN
jgi:hypothetical protein